MRIVHRERVQDIDVAKGFAIFLVVVGHVVARQTPLGNEWYSHLKMAIYSFHMAFFMFLSGAIFFAVLQPYSSFEKDAIFIKKRFQRLMPAYLLFAVLVFFGKLVAQNFAHVDNPVRDLGDLSNILLFPMLSVSAFLWYIYALFSISVFVLLGLRITRNSIYVLLLISFALIFVPYVQVLAIGQITKFLFFFILGGVAIRNWTLFIEKVDLYWIPIFVIFLIILIGKYYSEQRWVLSAILSIPALIGLCRNLAISKKFFLFLGELSFSIYLMNTIAIGFVKAVLLKFADWNGVHFIIFFPILVLSGIFLPILIKKVLFVKFAWLDKITS